MCATMKKQHLRFYCGVFSGRTVGEAQGLKELLNIPNSARIVNLKFPRPGAWKLKVFAFQRHTYFYLTKRQENFSFPR